MQTLNIGLIREGKVPPDQRVALTPEQCREIEYHHPEIDIFVESSPIRIFPDEEYLAKGITVKKNMDDCDILLGIKEVPIDMLISGKTYFFFSHTIKEQPYNRNLLRAILDKKIRLIDYECLTDKKGRRLIGFGFYAGIVGAYNGFMAWGKKYESFELKPANQCKNRKELEAELRKVKLPRMKIVLTGHGRVAKGVIEIFKVLGIEKVSKRDFLEKDFDGPVYAQLHVTDYAKRRDGKPGSLTDFFEHYTEYESDFIRYAKVADMFVAGHYWAEGSPHLYTKEEAALPEFNIKVVADISCDIAGPIASTIRPSTIDNPFYGYDPKTGKEVPFDAPGAITVMAVDNLPSELPWDASEGFGREFITNILPQILNHDKHGILERATIAKNGKLTAHYSYLQDYVDGK